MGCEEYTVLISARLDGELTPEEAARLDAHLAVCPQCRILVRELEEMKAALAQEEPVQAPEQLSRGVLERIRLQRAVRRRVVRRIGGLAAALVLCAGLYPMLRAAAPAGKSGMAMEAADAEAPMEPARYAEQEPAADGALLDTAAEVGGTSGETRNGQVVSRTGEEYKYAAATQAKKKLRLSDTEALTPAAEVLDSVQGLEAFLAVLSENDRAEVMREYGEDFFCTGRLLAVVVREPSSSITNEVTGLDELRVAVKRYVPQAGDSDVACWLILVEGDEGFGSARALDVEWS